MRISDFFASPIWGYIDDEEGYEVMPVDYPGHLIGSSGGESLFILCEYIFNDGTKTNGVINIRIIDHSFYVLKFPNKDGSLFYFPVNSPLEGAVTPEQLALHLNKSVEDVFPIKFTTPFVFDDGTVLEGKYKIAHHT